MTTDLRGIQGSIRPGERATDRPLRADAALTFIGTIRTPWTTREDCPRQGQPDGPECRLLVEAPWDAALDGIEAYDTLDVLYWLNRARRDLVLQTPAQAEGPRGTFALRSPVRPNPIGTRPRPPRPPRGRRARRPRPRLPRRHAAPRHQARPLRPQRLIAAHASAAASRSATTR